MSSDFIGCAVVLALIICDVAAGYGAAIYNGNVDSSRMRKGLYHKAAEVFLMLVAAIVAKGGVYVGLPDATCAMVLGACVCMLAVMELTSILENVCKVSDLPISKVFALFGVDEDGKTEDE